MCEIIEGFKLCSCSETLKEEDADWKLLRLKAPDQRYTTIGETIGGDFSLENDQSKLFVLTELNNRNCFDFEYEPMDGDLLYLRKKKRDKTYIYKYQNGQWQSEIWGSLEHEHFDHGILK